MTQKAREGDESKRDWDFSADRGLDQEIGPKPSPDTELDGEPLSVSDYEECFIPAVVDY